MPYVLGSLWRACRIIVSVRSQPIYGPLLVANLCSLLIGALLRRLRPLANCEEVLALGQALLVCFFELLLLVLLDLNI